MLFCTEFIEIGTDQYPCVVPNSTDTTYIYNIIYNYTYPSEFMPEKLFQADIIKLKLIIDNGILEYLSSKNQSNQAYNITGEYSYFPTLDRYLSRYSLITNAGGTYLIMISFFIFALILLEVVKEKSNFIKIYLEMSQVSSTKY